VSFAVRFELLLGLGELLFEERERPEAKLAGAIVVVGGARALVLASGCCELLLEAPNVRERGELLLPFLTHRLRAWLEIGNLVRELPLRVHGVVVVVVVEAPPLYSDVFEAPLHAVELGRNAVGLDAHARRGFVDQIDRALRELDTLDVSASETHGADQRRIRDAHAVGDLEAIHDATKHGDRLVDRRRLNVDGDESARDLRVLVERLAHLVGGRLGDDAELAALESRSQHSAGAARRAVAAERREVRQIQDDLAAGVGDGVENAADSLLELAAELRAGDERRHLERDDSLALKELRDVVGGDTLR
jgi:hypothetical protein